MPKKPAPAQRAPFVMPDPLPTRLLMLETHDGSHDGSHIATYQAGQVYAADARPPMSAHLARVFLRAGWAVNADQDIPEPVAAPLTAPQGRQAGPSEQPSASPSEAKQDAPAPSQSDTGSPTDALSAAPALVEPVESQSEDA